MEHTNKGETVDYEDELVTSKDDIPAGHKIAIKSIKKGEYIIKYGEIIGMAIKDISIGEHVHVHNVASIRFREGVLK